MEFEYLSIVLETFIDCGGDQNWAVTQIGTTMLENDPRFGVLFVEDYGIHLTAFGKEGWQVASIESAKSKDDYDSIRKVKLYRNEQSLAQWEYTITEVFREPVILQLPPDDNGNYRVVAQISTAINGSDWEFVGLVDFSLWRGHSNGEALFMRQVKA